MTVESTGPDATPPVRASSFRSNVLKLLASSMTVQVIVLLSAPLIARLYAPDEIGVFGVFVAVSSMVAMLGTLRFEMAIVVSKGSLEARCLFWATLATTLCLNVAIGIIVWMFPELITGVELAPSFRAAAWLLPLSTLVHVALLGGVRIAGTCDAFGGLAVASFAGRSTDVAAKIVLALIYDCGWHGLIWGAIFGEAVTVLIIILTLSNWNWRPPLSRHLYGSVLKSYRCFPILNLPAALCSCLTDGLPLLLFAAMYDPYTAGILELSRRVLGRPSAMLGNQFYTVFYQKSREALVTKGTIAPLLERTIPALALLALGPFLIVGLWGRPLFAIAFGPEWVEAGTFAAILAPAWFLRAISGPIRVFNTLEYHAIDLSWQVFNLLVTFSSFAIGWLLGSPREVVACLSVGMTVSYIVHLMLNVTLSGASFRRMGLRVPTSDQQHRQAA